MAETVDVMNYVCECDTEDCQITIPDDVWDEFKSWARDCGDQRPLIRHISHATKFEVLKQVGEFVAI